MASGKYSSDNPLSDLILVEGAFVTSFLLEMPPLFAKIYLYLCYLCKHTELKLNNISSISQQLACSPKDFSDGLEYLSKKHLINYTVTPFSFEMLSATAAAKSANVYSASSLTAYSDYFTGIRALFQTRVISNTEYDKARDWVEIYGLSVEASLMLISHCIDTKDESISFSYIDKVALSWANDGIVTSEKAEEYLQLYYAKNHDVSKLLVHLGLKRTPTMDEIKLYQKWTTDMGFDLKAIKAACQETTKSLNPSLSYINRILEGLHALDLHTEKQIKAYLSESNNDRRLASLILTELGERIRAVSPVHVEALNSFKTAGFSEEALIFTARLLCEKGMHTFAKYSDKLNELKDARAFTNERISEELNKITKKPSSDKKNGSFHNFNERDDNYGDSLFTDLDKLEV